MAALLKRWRWALLIAALLALGLAFAFWPRAVLVDAGQVSKGRMVTGITDDGQTRAVDVYVVSAPVTGYLDRIELDVGDPVARGVLITRMTGRPSTPLDPRSRQELLAAGIRLDAAKRLGDEMVDAAPPHAFEIADARLPEFHGEVRIAVQPRGKLQTVPADQVPDVLVDDVGRAGGAAHHRQ